MVYWATELDSLFEKYGILYPLPMSPFCQYCESWYQVCHKPFASYIF